MGTHGCKSWLSRRYRAGGHLDIGGGATPDTGVRVRPGVIQVQVPHARSGRVAPGPARKQAQFGADVLVTVIPPKQVAAARTHAARLGQAQAGQ